MRRYIGSALLCAGALAAGLLLGGCSGDSGDDSAPAAAVITESNADKVAGQAVTGVDRAMGMQELAEAIVDLTDPTSTDNPQVVDCPDGGTMEVTWRRGSATVLTAGDSFQAVLSDCEMSLQDPALTALLNGSASVSVTGVSGQEGTKGYSLGLTASFKDLNIVEGEEDLVVNGGVGILETIPDLSITSTTLTTGGLKMTTGAAPNFDEVVTLSDFKVTELEDASGETSLETITVSGAVTSQSLGGRMGLATVIPFVEDAEANPHEGALRITGRGNNSVLLESESDTDLQLWLDLNGDGNIEMTSANPIDSTWDEVRAAAGF